MPLLPLRQKYRFRKQISFSMRRSQREAACKTKRAAPKVCELPLTRGICASKHSLPLDGFTYGLNYFLKKAPGQALRTHNIPVAIPIVPATRLAKALGAFIVSPLFGGRK
jgi:hypothetical protein